MRLKSALDFYRGNVIGELRLIQTQIDRPRLARTIARVLEAVNCGDVLRMNLIRY